MFFFGLSTENMATSIIDKMVESGIGPEILTEENKKTMENIDSVEEAVVVGMTKIIKLHCKNVGDVEKLYNFAPWDKVSFFSVAAALKDSKVNEFIVNKIITDMNGHISLLEVEMIGMTSGNDFIVPLLTGSSGIIIVDVEEERDDAKWWYEMYCDNGNSMMNNTIVLAVRNLREKLSQSSKAESVDSMILSGGDTILVPISVPITADPITEEESPDKSIKVGSEVTVDE